MAEVASVVSFGFSLAQVINNVANYLIYPEWIPKYFYFISNWSNIFASLTMTFVVFNQHYNWNKEDKPFVRSLPAVVTTLEIFKDFGYWLSGAPADKDSFLGTLDWWMGAVSHSIALPALLTFFFL